MEGVEERNEVRETISSRHYSNTRSHSLSLSVSFCVSLEREGFGIRCLIRSIIHSELCSKHSYGEFYTKKHHVFYTKKCNSYVQPSDKVWLL